MKAIAHTRDDLDRFAVLVRPPESPGVLFGLPRGSGVMHHGVADVVLLNPSLFHSLLSVARVTDVSALGAPDHLLGCAVCHANKLAVLQKLSSYFDPQPGLVSLLWRVNGDTAADGGPPSRSGRGYPADRSVDGGGSSQPSLSGGSARPSLGFKPSSASVSGSPSRAFATSSATMSWTLSENHTPSAGTGARVRFRDGGTRSLRPRRFGESDIYDS